MATITYSLTPVSTSITGGAKVYRANVQTNGTIDRDTMAAHLAARTKQDVALWKYFLDAIADELKTQILAGYRVNLGQLSTGFSIRGSFQSEDERWNPEKHQLVATVRTLDPLLSALKEISPENITVGLACTLYSAMDATTKHLNEITGSDVVLLQGLNLGIDAENEDEYVALVDPETGEIKAKATVTRSDAQTIDCRFDEPPAEGTYTLVVSCRNGARATLKPAVARIRNVVVKAAA